MTTKHMPINLWNLVCLFRHTVRRPCTIFFKAARPELFARARDVSNHGLPAFVHMDMLNSNELRAAVS